MSELLPEELAFGFLPECDPRLSIQKDFHHASTGFSAFLAQALSYALHLEYDDDGNPILKRLGLEGRCGIGKTHFAKHLIRALGGHEKSLLFPLLSRADTEQAGEILHYDCQGFYDTHEPLILLQDTSPNGGVLGTSVGYVFQNRRARGGLDIAEHPNTEKLLPIPEIGPFDFFLQLKDGPIEHAPYFRLFTTEEQAAKPSYLEFERQVSLFRPQPSPQRGPH